MFFKVLFVFDIFVVDDDYNFLWQECGKPLYMENNRDGILISFFFFYIIYLLSLHFSEPTGILHFSEKQDHSCPAQEIRIGFLFLPGNEDL